MASLIDSAVVWVPLAISGVVTSTSDNAVAYVLPATTQTVQAPQVAAAVPAGALQAEDATYLLTEAGDYLEAE